MREIEREGERERQRDRCPGGVGVLGGIPGSPGPRSHPRQEDATDKIDKFKKKNSFLFSKSVPEVYVYQICFDLYQP